MFELYLVSEFVFLFLAVLPTVVELTIEIPEDSQVTLKVNSPNFQLPNVIDFFFITIIKISF